MTSRIGDRRATLPSHDRRGLAAHRLRPSLRTPHAWWLVQRNEREEAAYYYGTAIALASVSALSAKARSADEGPMAEVTANTFARALVEPATQLIRAGQTLEPAQADALYALLVDKAEEHAEGLSDIVRSLLEDARRQLAQRKIRIYHERAVQCGGA